MPPQEELSALEELVRYGGNPEHKRQPGDFGLAPPTAPRPDKSICNDVGITLRADALAALRNGVRKGLVSQQKRGSFPQNIWSVKEGQELVVLEAQLENQVIGSYHGYPLQGNDALRETILEAWRNREVI